MRLERKRLGQTNETTLASNTNRLIHSRKYYFLVQRQDVMFKALPQHKQVQWKRENHTSIMFRYESLKLSRHQHRTRRWCFIPFIFSFYFSQLLPPIIESLPPRFFLVVSSGSNIATTQPTRGNFWKDGRRNKERSLITSSDDPAKSKIASHLDCGFGPFFFCEDGELDLLELMV